MKAFKVYENTKFRIEMEPHEASILAIYLDSELRLQFTEPQTREVVQKLYTALETAPTAHE